MRVAALYDVHGNLPALEAVLAEVPDDAARGKLSEEEIAFLCAQPSSRTLEVDGLGRVLFVHATPRNDLDIFTERTPEEQIAPLFENVDASVVVCGHTHTQFERVVAGKRVVNAGSVGMPYEDAPGAYWALLGPDVEHRRTDYEPRASDWPGEWPSSSRDEAVSHFETLAVRA